MDPVHPNVDRSGGPDLLAGDTHHYIFTVYAIDEALALPEGLNKPQILAAIDGHVLGKGELTGIYRR